jgi:hypothetical protein
VTQLATAEVGAVDEAGPVELATAEAALPLSDPSSGPPAIVGSAASADPALRPSAGSNSTLAESDVTLSVGPASTELVEAPADPDAACVSVIS